jgi:hypothetical protein
MAGLFWCFKDENSKCNQYPTARSETWDLNVLRGEGGALRGSDPALPSQVPF